MALPSNLYIPFQGLQTYFVNKDDGDPLSAGYVEFYEDVARTVAKDVYQQVQLPDNTYSFVNIGSIVTLSSVGTFQSPSDGTDIQVYTKPYDSSGNIELYYLKVYSVDNIFQFDREAMPPNVLNSASQDLFEGSDNQIENPQFVVTLLPDTLTNTYSVSGTASTPIAPDWSIETTGTGSVVVTQEPLSNIVMPTGAPFAINISSSGITSIKLRQRITQSPRMFGNGDSTAYISASMVAKNFALSAVQFTMDYVASNGYTVNLITQSTSIDSSYTTLNTSNTGAKAVAINSTNTNTPNTPGYVDIDIAFPVSSTAIGLTSVQIVAVENVSSSTQFLQVSAPRQIDHLFHYYKDPLIYKQIPSYLVGWDFPLNPIQIGVVGQAQGTIPATAIGANKSKYVWDQTIIFQSANSGVGVTRGSAGELVLTAATTTQMAIVQYVEGARARKILNSPICVNVSAKASAATVATVSLWYTAGSLPTVAGGTNDSIVATLDANGKPATTNPALPAWIEVPRAQGNAKFTIGTNATTNFNDYSFSGWDMAGIAGVNTATFFAIVVGTASVTGTGTVSFNSVSLQAGTIPTRPAPQTYDQVLAECQYFYETSYTQGFFAGDATTVGSLEAEMLVSPSPYVTTNTNYSLISRAFGVRFNTIKYSASYVFNVYALAGTIGGLTAFVFNAGSTQALTSDLLSISDWTQSNKGTKGITYVPANVNLLATTSGAFAGNFAEAFLKFHYEVDSRLGIV